MTESGQDLGPESPSAEDRVWKSRSREFFLTPANVAAELNVSLHAVYNLIRTGDIQAVNVAPSDNPGGKGCWRIRRQWVDDFIGQRLAAGAFRSRKLHRDRPSARSSRAQGFIPNHLDS
jgi:hypothetical protein